MLRSWFFLTLTLTTGCSFRTPVVHVPASLGASALHVEPDVRVVDATGKLDAQEIDDLRSAVRRAAESASSCSGAQATLATIMVEVEVVEHHSLRETMREDGLAALTWLAAPFGGPTAREGVLVDITVGAGPDAPHARGAATAYGGIYASARRKAVARALDQALASLR